MGLSSTKVVLDKIFRVLRDNNPHTIAEVAKNAEISYDSAKKYLEQFTALGIARFQDNKYYLADPSSNYSTDTLMGLPLEQKQIDETESLVSTIQKSWNDAFPGRVLGKTMLQKIAFEVILKYKLQNVPFGWYMYGPCLVLQKYKQSPRLMNIDFQEIIDKYGTFDNTQSMLSSLYTQHDKQLYLTRLKIDSILKDKFDETNILSLKSEIRKFAIFASNKDEQIMKMVTEFSSVIGRLVNGLNHKALEDIRSEISFTFSSLWETISTLKLKESLAETYQNSILERNYILSREPFIDAFNIKLDALYEYVPPVQTIGTFSSFKKAAQE